MLPCVTATPDNIHPHLLQKCAEQLAHPFYMIFRKSLDESTLPLIWKLAIIIAIFKKGSRYLPLNYRPISLTPVCGKAMERIIFEPLYNYFMSNDLLPEALYHIQVHYTKASSTITHRRGHSVLDFGTMTHLRICHKFKVNLR